MVKSRGRFSGAHKTGNKTPWLSKLAKSKISHSTGYQAKKRNEDSRVNKKNLVELLKEKKKKTHIENSNIKIPIKVWNRIQKLEKKESKIRKKRLEELSKKPFFVDQENVGSVGERIRLMKDPDWRLGYADRKKSDFNDFESADEIKKYKKILELRVRNNYFRERDEILQENYTKKLLESFGDEVLQPLDSLNGESIHSYLEKMDANEFYFFYMQHDALDFEVFYPESKLESINYVRDSAERISTAIHLHAQRGVDMDMVIMRG